MLVIGLALFALVAGQGYASVYLSTLPHTGLDGTAYVTFWALTVNVLAVASHWMLEEKIRSRALVFVFKVRELTCSQLSWIGRLIMSRHPFQYYYFLVYFICESIGRSSMPKTIHLPALLFQSTETSSHACDHLTNSP